MLCPKGEIQGLLVLCIPPLFLTQKAKPGETERRVEKRKRKKKGGIRNKRKEERQGEPQQERGNKKLSGGSSGGLLRLSATCTIYRLPPD